MGSVCAIWRGQPSSWKVNGWQNEDDYIFFLPSWSRGKIVFQAQSEIEVDGKLILPGDVFAISDNDFVFKEEGKKKRIVVMYSSEIPSLWLEMGDGELERIEKSKEEEITISGTYVGVNPDSEIMKFTDADLKCRGNVTFDNASKKSYLLKMKNASAFGAMESGTKWVLTSNFFDQTSMRNYMTMKLAENLKMAYVPEAEFVDLYINGDYRGMYLLGEKVEVGKGRVDIRNLEKENEKINGDILLRKYPFETERQKGVRAHSPENITGGYLVEFEMEERWDGEDSGFKTENGQTAVIQSPKHATWEETDYILSLFQEFEDARREGPESNRYLEYIDLDSFVKKYIIEELTKNIDANKTSQFFYKYDDSISKKIYAGPVWDYDKGWGNEGKLDEHIDLKSPVDFYAKEMIYQPSIWAELYMHDSFQEEVGKVWSQEVIPVMDEILQNSLMQWKCMVEASALMDWERWNNIRLDTDSDGRPRYEETYDDAVKRLIEFTEERVQFLNEYWG